MAESRGEVVDLERSYQWQWQSAGYAAACRRSGGPRSAGNSEAVSAAGLHLVGGGTPARPPISIFSLISCMGKERSGLVLSSLTPESAGVPVPVHLRGVQQSLRACRGGVLFHCMAGRQAASVVTALLQGCSAFRHPICTWRQRMTSRSVPQAEGGQGQASQEPAPGNGQV